MSDLMRTPLGRARGLGSAKDGTEHFWRQRVTSVALVPLTVFFLAVAMSLIGADHARAAATLATPWIAVPLMLVVLVSVVHMRLGMQVIVEDYVQGELAKYLLLMANTAFCAIVGLVGLVALLMLLLGV
jgi:succinate dehydrogenase / fumarate reductase, membrane anchor subunit